MIKKAALIVLFMALAGRFSLEASETADIKIPAAEVFIETVHHADSSLYVQKRATVRFAVNLYEADRNFADNAASLDSLVVWIKRIAESEHRNLNYITIRAAASPEGGHKYNVGLAQKRADSILDYIVTNTGIESSLISENPVGPDYEGLRNLVETSSVPYKDEVLDILDNTPLFIYKNGKAVDGKKKQLMDLRGGRPWFWMLSNLYPMLRRTEVVIDYTERVIKQTEPEDTAKSIIAPAVEPVIEAPQENDQESAKSISEPATQPEYEYRNVIAVGTNVLYDAAITPNFSIEVPMGNHWSAGMNYTFPWYVWGGNTRCYEILHLDIFGRYWFNPSVSLSGWFAGLNLGAGYYDIQPNGSGYQGEAATVSLEGGYSWVLGRHWRLNLSAAAGWMGSKYRKYDAVQSSNVHLVEKYEGNYTWFGPTRLNLGFTYLFGRKTIKK